MAHVLPDGEEEQGYGAYLAAFFHPTVGSEGEMKCSEDGILGAYEFLEEQEVTTVAESWGCEAEDGMTQDYRGEDRIRCLPRGQ
jgi:hypothetical protein